MKHFNEVLIEDCLAIYKTIMLFKGELAQLFLNKGILLIILPIQIILKLI